MRHYSLSSVHKTILFILQSKVTATKKWHFCIYIFHTVEFSFSVSYTTNKESFKYHTFKIRPQKYHKLLNEDIFRMLVSLLNGRTVRNSNDLLPVNNWSILSFMESGPTTSMLKLLINRNQM